MGTSFNLVRKKKKDANEAPEEEEEVDLSYQEEDDDDDSSSSPSRRRGGESDAKKRMVMLMGVVVGFIVILLFVLYIASLLGGGGKYTYEDVESVMKKAAESYFAAHSEYLPKNDGDIVEVNVNNLILDGYMRDLTDYLPDDVCAGTVQVEKAGGEYLYTPFLNCGNNYLSKELFRKVVEDNPLTTEGDGLYSYNSSYVFRGEIVNNYVQLENSLWRIVKIANEGNLVLISAKGIIYPKPWDNRFNEAKNYEAGVNTYNLSRMKEYLSQVYAGQVEFDDEKILSDKDRARIVSYDLCVGKRNLNSTTKNNSEECRQKVTGVKLGLLTLADYLYASLDKNCKNASSKSCTNYNYLAMDDEWWLATASNENDYEVFQVDKWGIVKVDTAATYAVVRPVIYLNTKVMYDKGTGTEKDPYTVK